MKFKWLIWMLAALIVVMPVIAAPPPKRDVQQASTAYSLNKWINVNKILMFVGNVGNFAYDAGKVLGQNDGLYYPYTTVENITNGIDFNHHVIFDAGIWLGAVDSATSDTLVTVAEYSSEFGPGTMDSSGLAAKYRVYKLYADSMASNPNSDYLNWPVDQGAPVDGGGLPKLTGDQMAWTVYNDGDPANHSNTAGNTLPMGVEVQQTTFALNREDALGNIVFLKFKIMNKGTKVLKNMYVSLWSDPDLGGASDDLVGCDSLLSLGFCYNATNLDSKYGATPPAVGFDFFQGPLEYTGISTDTGRMWGLKYSGYVNQPMSSFNKYINGTDPSSKTHTYNYMQGLNRDGTPYIYGGKTLKFFNSGDPVANVGDLDADPADRRLMLTTGPFTMRPGDSTEVLAAVIAGISCDRLTSINAMKFYDEFAQSAYFLDFNVPRAPKQPIVQVTQDHGVFAFKWTDTSETDPGDYPFEGYTILQGPTAAGPWKRILGANYDIPNGIATIYDNEFDITQCGVLNKPVKFGTDAGTRHWFSATTDYINGGPLLDATDYYFRVEAYSVNLSKTPKTLTSATVLKVTPRRPIPEKTVPFTVDNLIPAIHIGRSDGQVLPQVLNPDSLTGHAYVVYFTLDSLGQIYWTLKDNTTNSVLYTQEYNQGADPTLHEHFPMFGGMIVHVFGPSVPGLKAGDPGSADSGWTVPSGTLHFSGKGGGGGIPYEGFAKSIGWSSGPNGFFTGQGVGPDRLSNIEVRLAATDSLGVFSPTDSNVSYGYRYLRRASQPPAHPEFTPFIINPTGGYAYQEFAPNVPLSVWDIESNPPRRLVVGFMENNVDSGLVNGRYYPPFWGTYDNTSGTGPREWLFIFDTAYSTTADPVMQDDILNTAYMPLMYHATWTNLYQPDTIPSLNHWSAGDRMRLFASHINYVSDTFKFVAMKPSLVASGNAVLNKIRAVPNPYYLSASYDNSVDNRRFQFINLPATCTISIFTLTGERIAVIHKDNANDSRIDWNLLTDNQIPVASGIYIWVVEAPGFGQKIGKMAIFTEQEQLGTY